MHTQKMVQDKNGTVKDSTVKDSASNNGTNGKVGKNGTFSVLGLGVEIAGLGWGFQFWIGGLGTIRGLSKFNLSMPSLLTFSFALSLPMP